MSTTTLRNSVAAGTLAVSMLVLPACSSSSKSSSATNAVGAAATGAAPTTSAERVKLAKTKFVLNASLAAGAAYQWLYKPFKAGTFKSGAKGRTAALIKGGLAGAFTYNRLSAALTDAKGDPTLSKATDALGSAVAGIKGLPSKIKGGTATDADFNQVQNTVNGIKSAGASNGLNVTDQVPSAGQLTQMVSS
ncbi:hypothetical protein [Streptacidiphilus sp. P02-A3a]|uniref:hypothetical protein n=1 Tax=Streptacidiphilus sp. P02-A3a TaxID=2704468 RepID=UPI001CDC5744|nr:hypothetical protein [Streptacidiphilus sp. P02-A3a]